MIEAKNEHWTTYLLYCLHGLDVGGPQETRWWTWFHPSACWLCLGLEKKGRMVSPHYTSEWVQGRLEFVDHADSGPHSKKSIKATTATMMPPRFPLNMAGAFPRTCGTAFKQSMFANNLKSSSRSSFRYYSPKRQYYTKIGNFFHSLL